MKEALGELNLTVVTIVVIAAVGVFLMLVVWPAIRTSIENQQKCTNDPCAPGCPATTDGAC